MNKIIPLSLMAVLSLQASQIALDTINVESTKITEVSQNAKTSADLAQALSSNVPSIEMSRRSGISNDIFIRGQKRDNISVEVDGTKVCGACPNRMDPPVSHVLASQIDTVEVIEGPYDVETFGTMSGGVKIKTKQPTAKKHGAVNFGFGSFGYVKVGATASGGDDKFRLLISGSSETSKQYIDGNGNTMAQQIKNYAALNPTVAGTQYQPQYEDMKAYKKKTIMTKAFVNITQEQELRLSYTANRSNDVLYPNTSMDAIRDDSNIYSVEYNADNITNDYENLNLQYYYSDVDHPMSTEYRKSAAMNNAMNMTNHMYTTMQGVKFKNKFNIAGHMLTLGLDNSKRTWRGEYSNNVSGMVMGNSIDKTLTTNTAAFLEFAKSFGELDFKLGARYDATSIKPDGTLQDNEYTGINANIFTTYNLDTQNKLFLGLGQANRVPDARELYFKKSGSLIGTPTLEQTTNQELDLGYEINSEAFKVKIKTFYSMLQNYIYIQKGVATNAFTNIDATVYGAELSSSIYAADDLSVDMSASYKKGQKNEALSGQTDKDLADITPLRGTLACNYEYMNNSIATLETVVSDKWTTYDADNGEQELGAWGIVNAKVKHSFNQNIDFTLGVNNLFDEAYAQSNTYADLTLITAATSDVMLLNEPGRYVYTNLDFKF